MTEHINSLPFEVIFERSENGSHVIVKVVNPTDEPATLRIKGDWAAVKESAFEYYAPGSLTVANSMENKHAVALQKAVP